jgi:hypothetical protein
MAIRSQRADLGNAECAPQPSPTALGRHTIDRMAAWRHRLDRFVDALGNMRANGARSLDISCWQCLHR